MGIALLGLAMGGIGCYAAILHLILHSFTKAGLFYQYGSVYRIYKSDYISDAGNYFEYNVPGSLALMLGFFIITAIPPSGMFVSEFMVFRSMFEKRYLWLLIVIGVLMTFIIWSIGENIFRLLFHKSDDSRDRKPEKISPFESVPQFALFLAVIYLGFNPPGFVVNLINEAVRNLH
jgi:hydrogenase-4 component F